MTKKTIKQSKPKVRIKRHKNGELFEKELKATIKVLNGTFGRLDYSVKS